MEQLNSKPPRRRNSNVLYEGDLIYLHIDAEGDVHSDGFVDERIGCLSSHSEQHLSAFDGCLFRVLPKLSYEAHKSLQKTKEQYSELSDKYQIMQQQLKIEEESNKCIIRNAVENGNVIKYGQVVQFQHVRSGKFITSNSKTLADVEKTSMKVSLVHEGSSKSWFTFLPRYKTRVIGSELTFGDIVSISRSKHNGQYLHVSQRPFLDDDLNRREIGVNFGDSRFRVYKYSEGVSEISGCLQVGKIYRIYHLDAQSYVTMTANPYHSKPPYLRQILPDTSFDDKSNFSLKSLFVLEKLNPVEGGRVIFDQKYRFRHLATGKYLQLNNHEITNLQDDLVLSGGSAKSKTSEITLNPTFASTTSHSNSNNLHQVFHIVCQVDDHTKYWLHNTNETKANNSSNKKKASFQLKASTTFFDQDCFRLVELSSTEMHDALFLSSTITSLRRYKTTLALAIDKQIPMTHKYFDESFQSLRALLTFFDTEQSTTTTSTSIITSTTAATTSTTSSSTNAISSSSTTTNNSFDQSNPLGTSLHSSNPTTSLTFRRQEQAREIKLLDVLYEMLRTAGSYNIHLDSKSKLNENKVLHRLQCLINKVLVAVTTSNICNKLYIAKQSTANYYQTKALPTPTPIPSPPPASTDSTIPYIEETRLRIGSETGSKNVYCSLFINNRILLETNVNNQLIRASCESLEAKGVKSSGILVFLAAICSINEKRLPRNQELILREIYCVSEQTCASFTRQNVLIEACECALPLRQVSDVVKEYVLNAPHGGENTFSSNAKTLGYSMLYEGLPNIVISWKSISNWEPGKKGLYFPPTELGLVPTTCPIQLPADLEMYEKQLQVKHNCLPVTREWVLLEHITWTLQPEILFPLIFENKSWQEEVESMKKDPERQENFERLKSLAYYYNLQLTLFAELLRGGCVASIEAFSKQFTYNMLISAIANEKLPYLVRTSFCHILQLCWINRFPHEPMLIPKFVHAFDDIMKIDKQSMPTFSHFALKSGHPALESEDAFVSYSFANKFAFIQAIMHDIISKFMLQKECLNSIEVNVFIGAILDMITWLVKCGFYPDMESYERLCNPLIRLLDGRNTANVIVRSSSNIINDSNGIGGTASSSHHITESQNMELDQERRKSLSTDDSSEQVVDSTQRYKNTKLNRAITKCKTQICRILSDVNLIWRDYEIYCILSYFKYTIDEPLVTSSPLSASSSAAAVVAANSNASSLINSGSNSTSNNMNTSNIGSGAFNDNIQLTKAGVQKFINLFSKSSLNVRLLSKAPLETICMDLIMYEDDELVNATLSIMIEMNTTRDQVRKYLMECILIRPTIAVQGVQPSSNMLKALESLLPSFKHDIQVFQSPDLCNQLYDKEHHFIGYEGVAKRVIQTLLRLQDCCCDITQSKYQYSTSSNDNSNSSCTSGHGKLGTIGASSSGKFKGKTNVEKQTIVLQFKVHEEAMKLIQTDVPDEQFIPILLQVKSACCDLLKTFLLKNLNGQQVMYQFVPELIRRIEELSGIGEVLVSIFLDNRDLCLRVPEEALWTIAKLLNQHCLNLSDPNTNIVKKSSIVINTIISFFTAYIAPDNIPVKSSQVFLFSVLSNPQFKHIIPRLADGMQPHFAVGSNQIKQLPGYQYLNKIATNPDSKYMVEYVVQIIELISVMCHGKNCKTEVDCQQLYPFSFILTLLLDPMMTLNIKSVAGKFLSEVYFDTDLKVDPRILIMPSVWDTLLHCSRTIAEYNLAIQGYAEGHERHSPTYMEQLTHYVFTSLLPIVTSFFTYVYNNSAEDLDISTVQIVETLKSDIRSLKKRGKLNPRQTSACELCGVALGLSMSEQLKIIKRHSTLSMALLHCSNTGANGNTSTDGDGGGNSSGGHKNKGRSRKSVNRAAVYEVTNTSSFDQFKVAMYKCDDVTKSIAEEFDGVVKAIETVETLTKKSKSNVSEDPLDPRVNTITMYLLCSRIIQFVKDNPTAKASASAIDALMQIVSANKLTEEGRKTLQYAEIEEAQDRWKRMQVFMAGCGSAQLVLKLIAGGYSGTCSYKAMVFGIELMTGGNEPVQKMMFDSMKDGDERFFTQIDRMLHQMIDDVKSSRRSLKYAYDALEDQVNDSATNASSTSATAAALLATETVETDSVINIVNHEEIKNIGDVLLRFLTLLAEGHNLDMQMVMFNQNYIGITKSVNILQSVATYLATLAKDDFQIQNITKEDCVSLDQCWQFLAEYMQGPCSPNQEFLTDSVMVEIFRKILKAIINTIPEEGSSSDGGSNGLDFPRSKSLKNLFERSDKDKASSTKQSKAIELSKHPNQQNHGNANHDDGLIAAATASAMDFPFSLPSRELVKDLKSNAVRAMVSLLEGRCNDRVEVRLRSTLELKCIKNRMLEIYEQFLVEGPKHVDDVTWDERFLEEGLNLYTLAISVFKPSLSRHHNESKDSSTDEETLAPKGFKNRKYEKPPVPKRGDYSNETAYKKSVEVYKRQIKYAEAYSFFTDRHCSVEVWWGEYEPRLDKVYFPMPSHCRMLKFLEAKRKRLLDNLDYRTSDRLKQFAHAAAEFDEEMQHIENLSNFLLYNLIRPYIPLFKTLSFLLALFMNLIMLVSLRHPDQSNSVIMVPSRLNDYMKAFGSTQIFLSVCVLAFMLVIRVPLAYKTRLNVMTKNCLRKYNTKQRRKVRVEMDSALFTTESISASRIRDYFFKNIVGIREELVHIFKAYKGLIKGIVMLYLLELTLIQAFENSIPAWAPIIALIWPILRNTRIYFESSPSIRGLVYTLIYDVVFDKYIAFYSLYLLTAFLGRYYHMVFYGFHLLDLVVMSRPLQNVVRAVTKPANALLLTSALGLCVIYMFAMILFFFNTNDMDDEIQHIEYCETLFDCFLTFVHRGLINGGGIGDYLTNVLNHPPNYFVQSNFAFRTIYDLGFFVIVIVLLLNIIFGITIDTFGELRTEANEKENLKQNQCFICGLSRETFDNHYMQQGISQGFQKHITEEHNMWNYMYFIVHVNTKETVNCTGPEAYVKSYLNKDDLSWFPQNRAKCFAQDNKNTMEQELTELKQQIKTLSAQMEVITTMMRNDKHSS